MAGVAAHPITRDTHIGDDHAVSRPGLNRVDKVDRRGGARVPSKAGAHAITQISRCPSIAGLWGQQGQQRLDAGDEIGADEDIPVDGARDLIAEADGGTVRGQGHTPVFGVHGIESTADDQQQVSAADECVDLGLVGRGFDGERMPGHDTSTGVRRHHGCTESLCQGAHGRIACRPALGDTAARPDDHPRGISEQPRECRQ